MTRQEAIDLMVGYECHKPNGQRFEAAFVDRLSILGLLKLDEPKSGIQKLNDELAFFQFTSGEIFRFHEAVGKAGLKIVESDK